MAFVRGLNEECGKNVSSYNTRVMDKVHSDSKSPRTPMTPTPFFISINLHNMMMNNRMSNMHDQPHNQ